MYSKLRELLIETFRQWGQDRVPLLAAALSFYTLFSLAPLVLIAVSVAGMIFGKEAARDQVYTEIQMSVGPSAAEAIQSLVQGAQTSGGGVLATLIGLGALLLGASAVFAQLKSAMNVIWNVEPPKSPEGEKSGFLGSVRIWVRQKLFSFSLVLIAGLLLVVSLVATLAVSVAFGYLESITPIEIAAIQVGDILVSLLLVTVVFALIFKFVPDTKVRWQPVWTGAFVTSILFNTGKFAISFYLGQSAVASAYGAAGSLVLLLLWVYYACQIVFFGAELTQVLADPKRERASEKLAEPA